MPISLQTSGPKRPPAQTRVLLDCITGHYGFAGKKEYDEKVLNLTGTLRLTVTEFTEKKKKLIVDIYFPLMPLYTYKGPAVKVCHGLTIRPARESVPAISYIFETTPAAIFPVRLK